MSNIETLLEKIEADSVIEQQSIIDAAKKEAEEIVYKAKQESEEKAGYVLKKTEEEAQNILEKANSRSELESRDRILRAKQEVFEKVLKLATEKLNNLSEEDYLNYIRSEINSVELSNNAQLLVMDKYKNFIINKLDTIKVSDRTVDSGFVVEDGNIIYNNDFKNIIENNRSEIEEMVFNELFNTDFEK